MDFETLCNTWGHMLSSGTWSWCRLLWWMWGWMVSVTNLHLICEQEVQPNLFDHIMDSTGILSCSFCRPQKHLSVVDCECDWDKNAEAVDISRRVCVCQRLVCLCLCWFMWFSLHKNLSCWSAKCSRKSKHKSHHSMVHDPGVTSQLA